ncbi:hypothetical protein NEHOM01_0862 [Nematocida homosporus]|uniref:uncharacterized protein n=1 Tax=Nematocida homosporus TaxID=1912981 RepID=UPI0022202D0B|nr:uncharacterized protein NEHOM01_0862 [Nematocida homosporus]KAI5185503.1 hypothetical protein NEHOM01_0862 [Nematocida homosporus]
MSLKKSETKKPSENDRYDDIDIDTHELRAHAIKSEIANHGPPRSSTKAESISNLNKRLLYYLLAGVFIISLVGLAVAWNIQMKSMPELQNESLTKLLLNLVIGFFWNEGFGVAALWMLFLGGSTVILTYLSDLAYRHRVRLYLGLAYVLQATLLMVATGIIAGVIINNFYLAPSGNWSSLQVGIVAGSVICSGIVSVLVSWAGVARHFGAAKSAIDVDLPMIRGLNKKGVPYYESIYNIVQESPPPTNPRITSESLIQGTLALYATDPEKADSILDELKKSNPKLGGALSDLVKSQDKLTISDKTPLISNHKRPVSSTLSNKIKKAFRESNLVYLHDLDLALQEHVSDYNAGESKGTATGLTHAEQVARGARRMRLVFPWILGLWVAGISLAAGSVLFMDSFTDIKAFATLSKAVYNPATGFSGSGAALGIFTIICSIWTYLTTMKFFSFFLGSIVGEFKSGRSFGMCLVESFRKVLVNAARLIGGGFLRTVLAMFTLLSYLIFYIPVGLVKRISGKEPLIPNLSLNVILAKFYILISTMFLADSLFRAFSIGMLPLDGTTYQDKEDYLASQPSYWFSRNVFFALAIICLIAILFYLLYYFSESNSNVSNTTQAGAVASNIDRESVKQNIITIMRVFFTAFIFVGLIIPAVIVSFSARRNLSDYTAGNKFHCPDSAAANVPQAGAN